MENFPMNVPILPMREGKRTISGSAPLLLAMVALPLVPVVQLLAPMWRLLK